MSEDRMFNGFEGFPGDGVTFLLAVKELNDRFRFNRRGRACRVPAPARSLAGAMGPSQR